MDGGSESLWSLASRLDARISIRSGRAALAAVSVASRAVIVPADVLSQNQPSLKGDEIFVIHHSFILSSQRSQGIVRRCITSVR